jgi:hypothetical protein
MRRPSIGDCPELVRIKSVITSEFELSKTKI